MDALSTNQVLTLFGKWERENETVVLLFSAPSAAMSFKNGRIVPFLDNCLILSFGEDNITLGRRRLHGGTCLPANSLPLTMSAKPAKVLMKEMGNQSRVGSTKEWTPVPRLTSLGAEYLSRRRA